MKVDGVPADGTGAVSGIRDRRGRWRMADKKHQSLRLEVQSGDDSLVAG
jgi:hypothetical protein